MKCVCRTPCQARVNDKILTFAAGQVVEFDGAKEAPIHFESLESVVPDFATATDAELLAVKWSYKQVNEFTKAAYQLEMPIGSKAEMVMRLVDMRLRHVERT